MAVWNVIQHTELGASAATVTHGSISGSYDHLYGIISCRSDQSAYTNSIMVQFNNDTGGNYGFTDIQSANNTPSAYSQDGATQIGYPNVPAASALADTFGVIEYWIPHYSNTANFKPCFFKAAAPNVSTTASQAAMKFTGAIWESTAAITEIDFTLNGGHDYVQYSTFTLYGINGAG
jgi:hypothetical protein